MVWPIEVRGWPTEVRGYRGGTLSIKVKGWGRAGPGAVDKRERLGSQACLDLVDRSEVLGAGLVRDLSINVIG